MAEYLANLIKDLPYGLKEALLKNGHIETVIFFLTKISQERFMKPFHFWAVLRYLPSSTIQGTSENKLKIFLNGFPLLLE